MGNSQRIRLTPIEVILAKEYSIKSEPDVIMGRIPAATDYVASRPPRAILVSLATQSANEGSGMLDPLPVFFYRFWISHMQRYTHHLNGNPMSWMTCQAFDQVVSRYRPLLLES